MLVLTFLLALLTHAPLDVLGGAPPHVQTFDVLGGSPPAARPLDVVGGGPSR